MKCHFYCIYPYVISAKCQAPAFAAESREISVDPNAVNLQAIITCLDNYGNVNDQSSTFTIYCTDQRTWTSADCQRKFNCQRQKFIIIKQSILIIITKEM